MYQLYGFFTQNSMKPHYVMEELGVDFNFHFVDLLKGEHMTEEFKRMTPVGKVPVLEHDGAYLFESGAICRYVANVENSPLYPQHKLQRAYVDQWMDFFTCHTGRWLTELFFEQIIKPKAGMGETNAAACERAGKFLHAQLPMLNDLLENSDWLANNTLSIADLFAFAYVEQFRAIDFPLDNYPHIRAWFDRIEGRESVAQVRARTQT